ncbi:hypothetical protein ACTFIR_010470 [Dictyostelium discoideum]
MFFDIQKNEKAESIKVYSDFVDPRDLSNVNQLNHLHTLLISTQFHEIVDIVLGISKEFGGCRTPFNSVHKDNIINDWESMIESLNSSKSLKNLTISSPCRIHLYCVCDEFISKYKNYINNNDDSNNDEDLKKYFNILKIISNGIKLLLSSTSSLEYFKINISMILWNDTFSVLNEKKSIKTLVFENGFKYYIYDKGCQDVQFHKNHYYIIIQYLIENVFSVTTSNIRHFKFSVENPLSLQTIFKLILNHINTIQLYSIKIKITEKILESTLDEIFNLSNKFSEKQQHSNQSFKNLKSQLSIDLKLIILNDINYY